MAVPQHGTPVLVPGGGGDAPASRRQHGICHALPDGMPLAVLIASVREMIGAASMSTDRLEASIDDATIPFAERAEAPRLTRTALLHDIGEAVISLTVLDKPGPLDRCETALMLEHGLLGWSLLRDCTFADPCVLAAARPLHEYLDGNG